MYYLVSEQLGHDPTSGWGYYYDPKSGAEHLIAQMVDLPVRIKIDDLHAVVFSTNPDAWWIGGKYLHERDQFDLQGPYTDVETALSILRLLGDVKRHFD
jgi:hypothetical protein